MNEHSFIEVPMRVLVTGGLGLVGRSVVVQLLSEGHVVRLFDTRQAGPARRIVAALEGHLRDAVRKAVTDARRGRAAGRLELVRGDLCNIADVGEAVRDVDATIHLGALIPPAADRNPRYASYVNEGGTANVVRALRRHSPWARLVFTSSIAVYGDRRDTPPITTADAVHPGSSDTYARQKLSAERIVRASGLSWVILRLTYIVSPQKLRMDPLMFRMPLDTRIEVCSARDTARALVNALTVPAVVGKVLNIAGGSSCRTTYRDYLDTMTQLFGLGRRALPVGAFSTDDFHCGYVDTAESQALLSYQSDSLADYYGEVKRAVRVRRALLQSLPLVRRLLAERVARTSPYLARPGIGAHGVRGRSAVAGGGSVVRFLVLRLRTLGQQLFHRAAPPPQGG
jgi:nucleoside-diphosphate-sugar epimerase